MGTFSDNQKRKNQYVKDNLELFEKAYIEHRSHKKHDRVLGIHFKEFMTKVRLDFKYSENTGDVDIWSKFQFIEINLDIMDRITNKTIHGICN